MDENWVGRDESLDLNRRIYPGSPEPQPGPSTYRTGPSVFIPQRGPARYVEQDQSLAWDEFTRTLTNQDKTSTPKQTPLPEQQGIFSPISGLDHARPDVLEKTYYDPIITNFDVFETPESMARERQFYEDLCKVSTIENLRHFVMKNYKSISWLNYLKTRLQTIVSRFASTYQKSICERYGWNLHYMLNTVWDLLAICKKKLNLLDTSFIYSTKSVDAICEGVELTRKKMTNLILELQDEVEKQRREILSLKEKADRASYLKSELEAARKLLRVREERDIYHIVDPGSSDEFMRDLEYRLATQEHLNSSFREDLNQERKSKIELEEMYKNAQRQRMIDMSEQLKKYDECKRLLENNEIVRGIIIPIIQDLEPDRAKVEEAVDKWIKTMIDLLSEKEARIDSLTDEIKRKTYILSKIEENVHNLSDEIQIADCKARGKRFELDRRNQEISAMNERLEELNEVFNRLRGAVFRKESGLTGIKAETGTPTRVTAQDPDLSVSVDSADVSAHSIEQETMRTSPISPEYPRQLHDSFLIEQTPSRRSVHHSPSPPRYTSAAEITLPSPPLGIASPFATTPLAETPFISKSRFGYTDPDVRFRDLNVPPGPFEAPTPFQQTIVLTSPKREEPLLVNIAVDPKPLKDTERGERFVCDISLDVQPGHRTSPQPRGISEGAFLDERVRSPSPVIRRRRKLYKVPSDVTPRYNVPPDVTPTTTRRHGPFTPRGIFKRGQFNIRRIPGEDPIPDLPWSPTCPQENARSPASPFPHWLDRSISGNRSNESYRGSPQSSPAVIQRRFYGHQLSDSDRSSPSPMIKGQYAHESPYSPYSPDWIYTPSPQEWQYTPSLEERQHTPPSLKERQYTPSPSVIERSNYRYRSPISDSPVPLSVTQYHSIDSYPISPSETKESSTSQHVPEDFEFNLRSPGIRKPKYRYPSSDFEFNLRSPGIRKQKYGYPSSDFEFNLHSPGIKGPTYQYQSPVSDRGYQSPVTTPVTPGRSFYDSSNLNEGRFLD